MPCSYSMQSVMYRDRYVLQSVMSGDLDTSTVSDVLDLELGVGRWGRMRRRHCVGASLLIHFTADNCTSGFLTGWFCLQVLPAVDCIYCACCWHFSQPCSCFQWMLVWGLNTLCWILCIVCILWTACIRTGDSLMTGQALGLWYLHRM